MNSDSMGYCAGHAEERIDHMILGFVYQGHVPVETRTGFQPAR
jgi:hypothetical protein